MPRLNVSYLKDRVWSIRSKKTRELHEQYNEECKFIREDWLKKIAEGYDLTEVKRLDKKEQRLLKQLDAVKRERREMEGHMQVDYPYLYFYNGGFDFRSRSYGDNWTLPKELEDQFDKAKKEHEARDRAVEHLVTAFLDKVMLGEATGEMLTELIDRINDL
jgi:hypothetical protein